MIEAIGLVCLSAALAILVVLPIIKRQRQISNYLRRLEQRGVIKKG
jgi:hypothetical protein